MTLASAWFALIAVLFAGYAVLDGFDLGVGILYPFLGRSEEDKAIMRRSVGPVWDGNEVWLITAGGALFAAFPAVYATVFSGMYLALALLLFALIFRAASLEFRQRDPAWARFWDWSFFVGSAIPSLLFGVAVGNVVRGLPLTAAGEMIAGGGSPRFLGNLLAALNPYAIVIGVLSVVWIVTHGAAWLSLKTTGGLRARATSLRKRMLGVYTAVAAVATLATAVLVPSAFAKVTASVAGWLFVVIEVLAVVLGHVASRMGKDKETWYATAAAGIGLVGIWAAAIYPALVPALPGSAGEALTITNASSSDLTLTVMLIVAVICIPLVLFYHAFVYKTYAGRIEPSADDAY
ncbi:MAG: cytochrome d ubiquinol oxidase subunit II [Coriobacteriales bacterium]